MSFDLVTNAIMFIFDTVPNLTLAQGAGVLGTLAVAFQFGLRWGLTPRLSVSSHTALG